MKFRLLGVASLLGGLAAFWLWVLGPIREAQAQAPVVKYSIDTFLAAPLGVVIGLLLIGWGEKVWAVVHGDINDKKVLIYRILLVAGCGLIAWLSWSWFEGQMATLGYAESKSS